MVGLLEEIRAEQGARTRKIDAFLASLSAPAAKGLREALADETGIAANTIRTVLKRHGLVVNEETIRRWRRDNR